MSDALPADTRRRVMASAALMVSDVDGEALAATRALCRQLGKYGLDPVKVLEVGLLRYLDEPPAARRESVQPMKMHQYTARQCLGYPRLLTPLDRVFLGDLQYKREATDADIERLNDIALRVERGRK